jgi:bacteriocin biosynthesis cyclodehydratase domain-containing protein
MQFETAGPNCVRFASETETHWLKGRGYPLVLPLIDGHRTAFEIATALDREMTPEEVHYVLAVLEKQGFLTAPCLDLPQSQCAYWRSIGIDPARAARHLAETPVSIVPLNGSDEYGCGELKDALISLGVRTESNGGCEVVVTSNYRDPRLAEVNRAAIESGRRWCLVNPYGRVSWIGPLFRPGATACWACLAHRLEQNQLTAPRPPAATPSPSRLQLALHLVAGELAKAIALDGGASLEDLLLTFDVGTLSASRHRVTRRPQCSVCGDPSLESRPVPIFLSAQPKHFDVDGGYRGCPPEETLERLSRHISPITGIVPSISRRDKSDDGPAVFTAPCNAPLGSWFHRDALSGRSSLSAAGKGMTWQQSRVSCIAEAIERYSACFQGHEPRIRATYTELGAAAVHPSDLLGFSDCQYLHRNGSNRIPERYDREAPIEWAACWSLSCNALRYLPAPYCYLDYSSSDGRFCLGDSNGCAGGNTIEEAVLQGFLELVERDAIAIWWYNRLPRPGRDLASFGDPRLPRAAERLRQEGRDLQLLDISTDLGIPTFAAVCSGDGGSSIQVGFGAHLEERLAASRAVSEVHQTMLWARNTASPDITLEKQPHLAPHSIAGSPISLTAPSTDLRDDVTFCIEALRLQGLDMIVLDLTRPDIDFPVVRVAVPGLRHHQPRYGPGRLYDVPVRLGWLDAPLLEAELNTVAPPM